MCKKLIAGLAALLLAVAAWAGDAWKDKSYKDWDEKDLRKILNDSPWARQIHVDAIWSQAHPSVDEGVPASDNPPAPSGGSESGRTGGATAPSAPGAYGEPEQARTPQTVFLIRWVSARTLREAIGRSAVLRGAAPESEAEKFIAQQPPEYQIAVLGPDMTVFGQANEKSLKEKAYLLSKRSKKKLPPSRVDVQHSQDGKQIVSVVFSFSKKTEGGEATIALDEKGVEFICPVGQAVLKTNFELQKMANKQGVDL